METKTIILIFLKWRLLLLIPLILSYLLITFRSGFEYTHLWNYTEKYFPVDSFLIFPWANFDGIHYLHIASRGYIDEGRFFPLYPSLINLLSKILGGGETLGLSFFMAGFLISNLSFLGSIYLLNKLLSQKFSKSTIKWTLIFLLTFPTAFFFGSIYTESLYLFLTLLIFYLMEKRSWLLIGIFGMLLSLTRLTGILILLPIAYEFYILEVKGNKYMGDNFKKIVPLLLIPTGLLAFSYYCLLKWADPLYFLHAHSFLANARSTTSIVLPFQTVFRYLKILTTLPITQFEWWISLLEVITVFMVGILFFLGYKKKIRTSYLIYALSVFLVPVFSGTFSAMPRYVLVLFPIFVTLALIDSKALKLVLVGIFISLQIVLLMFFSKGYFVA